MGSFWFLAETFSRLLLHFQTKHWGHFANEFCLFWTVTKQYFWGRFLIMFLTNEREETTLRNIIHYYTFPGDNMQITLLTKKSPNLMEKKWYWKDSDASLAASFPLKVHLRVTLPLHPMAQCGVRGHPSYLWVKLMMCRMNWLAFVHHHHHYCYYY